MILDSLFFPKILSGFFFPKSKKPLHCFPDYLPKASLQKQPAGV
jgi:hypothetical protein